MFVICSYFTMVLSIWLGRASAGKGVGDRVNPTPIGVLTDVRPRVDGFVTIWEGLGPHFKRFLGALGDILVVWEGPGNMLEFRWILEPSPGTTRDPAGRPPSSSASSDSPTP